MQRVREERHWVSVEGEKVALAVHLPDRTPAFCVIACHGLGASKESEKYLLLGREFPVAGFALARFDFRGCGESDRSYSGSTVAGRVRDLQAVLGFLAGHPELDGRFGLLGSSMGGFVALFAAREMGAPIPVVTWNCPATLRGIEGSKDRDVAGLGPAFLPSFARGSMLTLLPGFPGRSRSRGTGTRWFLLNMAARSTIRR